jgi:hypothetical protein
MVRLANLERGRDERDDSSDGCVSIKHGQGAAASYGSEVFAEARLQIGSSDVTHDQLWSQEVWTINGRILQLLPQRKRRHRVAGSYGNVLFAAY